MVNQNNFSYTDTGEPQDTVEQTEAHPNKQLGFEISPAEVSWSFVPEFYPESFTQMKKKELDRYGGKCDGETVSIKSVKNREFNVTGKLLQGEVSVFQALSDISSEVDLISPKTERGGMECFVKQAELGQQAGWDPHHRQWKFEYTIDLVSTGRDEHDDNSNNGIVTALIEDEVEAKAAQLEEENGSDYAVATGGLGVDR
jgi:hypothetical protein